jgi:excisionase family DNA binding protein
MSTDLFGPKDLAEYLGVSIWTVYQWRSTAYGPRGFRVGRHVRYRRADVEKWIDAQKAVNVDASR